MSDPQTGSYEYYQQLLDHPAPAPAASAPETPQAVSSAPAAATFEDYQKLLGSPSSTPASQPEPQRSEPTSAPIQAHTQGAADAAQTFFSLSKNPPDDAAKLQSAAALAPAMGVGPTEALQNWDAFSTSVYGKPQTGVGMLAKIRNSWQAANITNRIYKIASGRIDDAKAAEIKALEANLPSHDQMLSSIPNAVLQFAYGLGAGAANVARQIPGVLAASLLELPKEVGSSIKDIVTGYGPTPAPEKAKQEVAAQTGGVSKLGTGALNYRLWSEGIPENVALPVAQGADAIMSALQLIPIGGAAGSAVAKEVGTRLLLGDGLKQAALMLGKGTAVGTGFGLAQGITTVGAEDIARTLANHIDGKNFTMEDWMSALKQIGIDTVTQAAGMGAMHLPAAFRVLGRTFRVVRGGALEKAVSEATTKALAENAPAPESAPTVEATHEVTPTAKGIARTTTFKSTETGEPLAVVRSHVTPDETIHIEEASSISQHPEMPDAKAAVVQFMRDHPGAKIEWNPSDAAGKAVRQQLAEDNPRAQAARAEVQRRETEVSTVRDKIAATPREERAPLEQQLSDAQDSLKIAQEDESKFKFDIQWFADENPDAKPLGDLLPGVEAKNTEGVRANEGAPSELPAQGAEAPQAQEAHAEPSSHTRVPSKGADVEALSKELTQTEAERTRLMEQLDAETRSEGTDTAPQELPANQAEIDRLHEQIAQLDELAQSYRDEMKRNEAALSSASDITRQMVKETREAGHAEAIAHGQELLANRRARVKQAAEVRTLIRHITRVKPNKMRPEWGDPVREIQKAFDAHRMTQASKDALRKLREEIENDEFAQFSAAKARLLDRAGRTPYRDLTMEELRIVHDAVMYYDKLQRDSTRVMVQGREVERQQAADAVRKEMPAPKEVKEAIYRANPRLPDKLKKSAHWMKNFFGDHMMGLDFLAQTLGGKTEDSMAYRGLFRNIHEGSGPTAAHDGGEVGALRYRHEIDDAQSAERQALLNEVRNIDAWRGERVRTGRFDLTRGERVQMLMLLKQGASREDLLRMGFGSRSMPDPNAITVPSPREWYDLEHSFTPQEREAARALAAGYKKIGLDVGAQHLRVNNFPLRLEDDYVPIDTMPIARGSRAEAESGMEAARQKYWSIGMPKGRTIERTGAIKPVYLRDAFEVFAEHRDWASNYVHLDQPLLNAAKLLHDSEAEITKRWGPVAYREIEGRLRKVAGEAKEEGIVGKGLRFLRGHLMQSLLDLNPVSIAANLMNFERFVSGGLVKARYATMGLADSLVHPFQVHHELKLHSPEYRSFHAEGGYSKDMAEALGNLSKNTKFARAARRVRAVLGYPRRLTDRIATRAGMRGAVFQALHEFGTGKMSPEVTRATGLSGDAAKHLSAEDRITYAYRYAEYALEHVNSVPLASLQSGLHMGNVLEQTIGAMGTDAVRAQQLFRTAFRNARRGDPKALRRLAALTIGMGLIEPLHYVLINYFRSQLTSKKKPPTPEDFKAMLEGQHTPKADAARRYVAYEMADQALYYMPVIRDAGRPVVAGLTRQYSSNNFLITDEIFTLANQAASNSARWASAPTLAARRKYGIKAIDANAHLVSALIGNPYNAEKLGAKLVTKP